VCVCFLVPGVFHGGKGDRCVRLTTLPPSCAVVMKSGNLNFLEPPGPLQACNGTVYLYLQLQCGSWITVITLFLQQNPTKESRYSVIWVATILSKLCYLQNSSIFQQNTVLSWPMTHGNIMPIPAASFINFQQAADLMFTFAFTSVVLHRGIS